MTHKNIRKVTKFRVLKCWMFSSPVGGLDVLYGGLGITKLKFLFKKNNFSQLG
jgi:hypothetical protein